MIASLVDRLGVVRLKDALTLKALIHLPFEKCASKNGAIDQFSSKNNDSNIIPRAIFPYRRRMSRETGVATPAPVQRKPNSWVSCIWKIKVRKPETLPPRREMDKLNPTDDDAVSHSKWMTQMLAFLADFNIACNCCREDKGYDLSFIFEIPLSRLEKADGDLIKDLRQFQAGRFYCDELLYKVLDTPTVGNKLKFWDDVPPPAPLLATVHTAPKS